MFLRKAAGPRVVTLPDGRPLSRADLPDPNTLRWVATRKRRVAEAVQTGLLSRQDAKRDYALSDFELDDWCCKYPIAYANREATCNKAVG